MAGLRGARLVSLERMNSERKIELDPSLDADFREREIEKEKADLKKNLAIIFQSLKLDESLVEASFLEIAIKKPLELRLLRELCAHREFVRVKKEGPEAFRERASPRRMAFFADLLNHGWKTLVFVYSSQLMNARLLEKFILPLQGNLSLQHLDLSRNLISDDGAGFIATFLFCFRALRSLYLAENTLTSTGFELISAALFENKTLSVLNLKGNRIDSSGLVYFYELLRRYQKLWVSEVRLSENLIRSEVLKPFNRAIAEARLFSLKSIGQGLLVSKESEGEFSYEP